mmetsp:Transcript_3181/g.4774  ORF Transcript_3181/g.4774 Transcript_3181/m.4774 type:complete len:298 (+) Transcript_3181:3-896(+)
MLQHRTIKEFSSSCSIGGKEPSVHPTSVAGSQLYEDQINELRTHLSQSSSIAKKYATQVFEYQQSLVELSAENDELVNDIHGIATENEEFKVMLNESQEKYRWLKKSYQTLRQERDALAEELETYHHESLQEHEISGIVDQIKAQTKVKLREAASQRQDLKSALAKISAEKDEMEKTFATMIEERKNMGRKMEAMHDIINDLTKRSNSSGLHGSDCVDPRGTCVEDKSHFSGRRCCSMEKLSTASRGPNLADSDNFFCDGGHELKKQVMPGFVSTATASWKKIQFLSAKSVRRRSFR